MEYTGFEEVRKLVEEKLQSFNTTSEREEYLELFSYRVGDTIEYNFEVTDVFNGEKLYLRVFKLVKREGSVNSYDGYAVRVYHSEVSGFDSYSIETY